MNEQVTEVPLKYRIENDEPIKMNNRKSQEQELKEIKATLSRFEEMLSNNILIRNPEFQATKSDGLPSQSKWERGKKPTNLYKESSQKSNKSRDMGGRKDMLNSEQNMHNSSESIETIYQRAVPSIGEMEVDEEIRFNFRGLSSSDEMATSSEEFPSVPSNNAQVHLVDPFYGEPPRAGGSGESRGRRLEKQDGFRGQSTIQPPSLQRQQHHQQQRRVDDGQERAEQIIHEAEAGRARIYDVPGKDNQIDRGINQIRNMVEGGNANGNVLVQQQPAVYNNFDDDYLLVTAHLDLNTQAKIAKGEYVDFAKLIPKEKGLNSDFENRMELVNRNGHSYFVPVTERESTQINSFSKWEQAFRVFSNVYTKYHPERAHELIEYNFMIHTASSTYVWDNVYHYDRDFRMHMERHPQRSWTLILQQAWSFRLKDKYNSKGNGSENRYGNPNNGNGRRKEICRRYNQGRCTYGTRCKYDHRCSVPDCGKYGHGAHNCRRNKHNGKETSDRTERTDKGNGRGKN